MRPSRFALILVPLALLLLGADGCSPAAESGATDSSGDTTVAARLDGEDITVDTVDAWIKEELFRQATENGNESKTHELRNQAVENLINERLVEREAKVRGIDSDALMEEEASKRMAVSEAEVLQFYEQNKESLGEMDFETAAVRVRQHLERTKGPQAARAFVTELRAGAEVEVLIQIPRIHVAATGPAQGPEEAPVTIVEFSDYQCPFCKRAEPVIADVLSRYKGKVRFVYRQFPLDRIHPLARPASEAALCAGDQEKFWDYHALLFGNNPDLTPEGLNGYAESLALDMEAFSSCVQNRTHQAAVEADVTEGRAAGVTGTPAFFVNGIVLKGAQPIDEFSRIIDAELAAAAAEPAAAEPAPAG